MVIALLAATFMAMAGPPAKAQEGQDSSYVDLVVTHYSPRGRAVINYSKIIFVVTNHGTAEALGVTVSFQTDLYDRVIVDGGSRPDFLIEELSSVIDFVKEGQGARFKWVVGDLRPGGSRELEFSTSRGRNAPDPPGGWLFGEDSGQYLIGSVRAEASSRSLERPEFKHNNVRTVYSFYDRAGASEHITGRGLDLYLSVDELRPTSASPDVNLELAALDRTNGVVTGIAVRVELSRGLEFKRGWTPPAEFVTDGRSATWAPEPIGTTRNIDNPSLRHIEIQTALTSDSLEDIPLEERCITAWVTESIPPPDPDYILGSLRQCLGDDPKVLINSGEIDLLTVYPCVGVSPIAYPCRDADGNGTVDNGLELVVRDYVQLQPVLRRSGIGRNEGPYRRHVEGGPPVLLRPESVVVQVKDPEGRRVSSGKIVWNSGSQSDADSDAAGLFPGAILDLSLPYDELTSKEYAFSISDMTPGGKPGSMKVLAAAIVSIAVLDSDGTSFSGDAGTGDVPLWFEFGALGTYRMNITIGHSEGSPSGTYTFHVGPVAELGVRDGGATPGVAGDQRAYSIVAVNNGPDAAPAAQVRVTGLNAGDYVSHTATAGTFDPDTGVWTIGELQDKDFYQDIYRRDGEVLTIITSAASARDITAAISNTRDYTVCIDSSGEDVAAASESACTATSGNTWHSAAYYDYIPGNNTAAIRSHAGTGAAHPEATIRLRVLETPVGNILLWQGVEAVNGRRVIHYEVQRWASPWATLDSDVRETVYVDLDGRAGADYRVRAVNEFGHEGPWSITGRPPDMPGNFSVALSDGGNAAVLRWTEPASPSPITGYVIDISDTADGDSRTNDRTVGGGVTTWTHTGLSGGDVKFYRVQARNRDGVGAWTAWQSVGAGPGARAACGHGPTGPAR